jgi:hypothetical protein
MRRRASWGARHGWSFIAVGLCVMTAARSAAAHTNQPEIPRHLVAGTQYFDASPAGFQAYLSTLRATNPAVYTQLAPDADRLAQRASVGRTILIAGFAAGLVSAIYGIAARNDCVLPPATDPNFAADSAAWDACNHDNMATTATFGLLGVGLATAGLIGWVAVTPSRDELLDLVNRHNRINPQPLQLQLGYDPVQHLARAGAVFSF